jgi:broad specificity phosphatase PhoE
MPDYEGASEKDAIADFRSRIHAYADVYEMMGSHKDEENLSWVRVEDGGRFVAMNRIRGYLQGRIVQMLSTLHTMSRPIYLSRHGQSQYNELGKIGGDSPLSEQGEQYSVALAKWAHKEILALNEDGTFSGGVALDSSKNPQLRSRLYTSSLKRTKDTAKHIAHPVCSDGWICMRPRSWKNLDEIFAGSFDGMTYKEIEEMAPEEFADRARSKLSYRYPRGESYLDVIERLEPVVMELERSRDPVLIIGHQGILRILYAYFTGRNRDEAPFVPIPLNTVIKLIPGTYSCEEQRFKLINPPVRENPYHVGSPDIVGMTPTDGGDPKSRLLEAYVEEPPSH